MDLYSAYHQ